MRRRIEDMVLTGIIIGAVFWVAGLIVFISDYLKVKRCTGEAEAVILDVKEEVHWRGNTHGSRRKIYYYPIIEFSTPDKTVRVSVNSKGYHPDTYIKGEKLKIQYNPQNPYDVKLRETSLWESAAGMVFLILLGTVLSYFCIRAG